MSRAKKIPAIDLPDGFIEVVREYLGSRKMNALTLAQTQQLSQVCTDAACAVANILENSAPVLLPRQAGDDGQQED